VKILLRFVKKLYIQAFLVGLFLSYQLVQLIPFGRKINTLFLHKIWNQTTTTEIKRNKKIVFNSPTWLTHYRAKSVLEKEPETIAWINNMTSDKIFWDIGANVGTYSIYAAKISGVKVISVEPSFLNLELLFRNIQSNNLEERINILPIALSNKSEFQQFFMSVGNLEWGGAHNSIGERIKQDGGFMEHALTSRQMSISAFDLIKLAKLEIPKYLKIDVDGLEITVLKSFNQYINSVSEILVEVDLANLQQIKKIKKFMEKHGFTRVEQRFNHIYSENQLWVKS
jgi:FkbM family methyltransferase